MVDGLVYHDDTTSISSLTVKDDNVFTKNGLFQEAGIIENIAQTAALREGYLAMMENKTAKKGFIGAVKRLKIYGLPKTNSTLKTTITILNQVMSAVIISGEVHVNNKLLAACEMIIFTEE